MKLIQKDNQPCIKLVIESPGAAFDGPDRIVSHEIPVNLYSKHLVLANDPLVSVPVEPTCDIVVAVPSLRIFKNVIERIRNLSNVIILGFQRQGSVFFVRMLNDIVSVKTQFKGWNYSEVQKLSEIGNCLFVKIISLNLNEQGIIGKKSFENTMMTGFILGIMFLLLNYRFFFQNKLLIQFFARHWIF